MSNLYGLIGQSLTHSLSPVIHQAIFNIIDLPAHYHLFEVQKEQLRTTLAGLRIQGAVGVNVTIPYKTEIMKYLDEVSPEALAIGSVNTITFAEHKTVGSNTDYYGFGMLLARYGICTNHNKALVLGYGGAAKAVIRYLLDHGADSVTVAVRNLPDFKGSTNPQEVGRITFVQYPDLHLQNNGDLVVNCTPCGMYPNIGEAPVETDVLSKYKYAVDLIYNPMETIFLQKSKGLGLKTVNGLYMLVSQAVAAHEIWGLTKLNHRDIENIYSIVFDHLKKISP
ncbi:MAG TPA: shikimate dehydrogenase [Candidatus Nitrosocosmicus sp.]|nr:shikimate dehydrogenase [Candidatus Nitrosocosmicus sp.]